ncbi:oxidoreductase [Jannaschia pagri]|uniref:Oxidoreductase n=1 Tax=Jannaschia pagri TaxID=2829797 RepID=A0ABQ4NHK5_9RHOB|nr:MULTISPECIES: Gfo/Idh/MocA family oxidoreductase [unclassified Jannaschia]GIT90000.1 oxidoreductase [Jannaschia sp. AI_61]GIT93894.1 oxidoreductase [Jannaschia sp. AI_62]
MKFGAIGIDHRHIFGMAANMIAAGGTFAGWWTDGAPEPLAGFQKRFPDVPRVAEADALLADPTLDLILISCIPRDRAGWAIKAMQAGKDVMVDKPGCTTLDQLAAIKAVQAETGRIWSVDFSERFEVPCVTRAAELVRAGAIGKVVQTVGLGPHRLNRATRPGWFFEREAYGGIITDIGSHQIDQFLYFTGSTDATVMHASIDNVGNPNDPDLQDFGEVVLQSPQGRGYIRLDWFTPDALPTWGDGRLTILGTEGYIELRKYVDAGASDATDTLILVNGERHAKIDASDAGMPYFHRLMADIRDRTETAMPQAHAFKVMELAITAQLHAERLGA